MPFQSRTLLLLILTTVVAAFVPQGKPSFGVSLNVAVDTSEIKNGMTLNIDDEPYKVVSFSIMKQARGAAKTTIKFKNLARGTTIENTYRSGEKFETALIERKKFQHTYSENSNFFFMDQETFEEVAVGEKTVGDKAKWISEGMEVQLVFFLDKVIEVQVPTVMVYTIVETDPTLKGANVNNYIKPAVLDCGATINVPGYLEQGESIKVDTEKEEFLERNKDKS